MTRRPRVGLVLSGGAARGFAHIGVLQALEARDMRVDAIAGTSMGAILGALYANGMTADEVYELADDVGMRDVLDFSLQTGLMKGEKLQAYLAAHLPARFEQLRKPFAVTTTDIESGDEHVLLEGDLVRAVRASSSFPGAFEPVELHGRTLADGGIVNNLPVQAVSLLDCDYIIASDTTSPRRSVLPSDEDDAQSWWQRMAKTLRLERRNPMLGMMLRSTDVMQAILTDLQYALHPANVRIVLDMPQYRVESFRAFRSIVSTGREVAERSLDAIARDRPDALPPTWDAPAREATASGDRS